MDFVKILCDMHEQQTSLPVPPFGYRVKFEKEKLNKTKYMELSHSKDKLHQFMAECANKFKTIYPNQPYGSVQSDPNFWVKIAIRTVANGYRNNQTEIVFPNGCCNQPEKCPINMMYQIVLEELCDNK